MRTSKGTKEIKNLTTNENQNDPKTAKKLQQKSKIKATLAKTNKEKLEWDDDAIKVVLDFLEEKGPTILTYFLEKKNGTLGSGKASDNAFKEKMEGMLASFLHYVKDKELKGVDVSNHTQVKQLLVDVVNQGLKDIANPSGETENATNLVADPETRAALEAFAQVMGANLKVSSWQISILKLVGDKIPNKGKWTIPGTIAGFITGLGCQSAFDLAGEALYQLLAYGIPILVLGGLGFAYDYYWGYYKKKEKELNQEGQGLLKV